MSFLALSNKSIRHLLVYGVGAGSLQFSKPRVPFSIKYAGKTLEVNISVLRYIYLDRPFVFIHHWKKNGGEGTGYFVLGLTGPTASKNKMVSGIVFHVTSP